MKTKNKKPEWTLSDTVDYVTPYRSNKTIFSYLEKDVQEFIRRLKDKDWDFILYRGLGYTVTEDEEQRVALIKTICETIDKLAGERFKK